jgi:hypothetical protein
VVFFNQEGTDCIVVNGAWAFANRDRAVLVMEKAIVDGSWGCPWLRRVGGSSDVGFAFC